MGVSVFRLYRSFLEEKLCITIYENDQKKGEIQKRRNIWIFSLLTKI